MTQNWQAHPQVPKVISTTSTSTSLSHWPCLRDVKNSCEAILIYNNVKSDLIIYMIHQSMFISKDESVGLVHRYVNTAKQRHGIKDYDVNMPLIQMVCSGWHIGILYSWMIY